MMTRILAACAAILFVGMVAAVPVHAQSGVQVGVLKCKTIPGTRVQLIIHSSVGLDCSFTTPSGTERYRGESGIGLGVDISWDRVEEIAYTVLSATQDYQIGSHSLAGKYVGAKASATAGVGAGAAALIGGGEKSITLQPLAIEGSTGVGVAAGAAYLFLAAK